MTAHSAADKAASGDKRERILAAAERVFARHGFFAAKVSEIAKEAGVADGTIYLYFKNKDELLEEELEEVGEGKLTPDLRKIHSAGKHLLVHFSDGQVLHTHMQMTGAKEGGRQRNP